MVGRWFRQWVNLVSQAIYPNTCVGCGYTIGHSDGLICHSCWSTLPETHFHKVADNRLEQMFWGRFPVMAAAALWQFRKDGRVQHLLHQLKYKGLKEIGFEVGQYYGGQLLSNALFKKSEAIIPVPMHPAKLRKRGYNQSEWFAMGLADSMKIPLETNALIKTTASETQTRKGRWKRWENVAHVFSINNADRLQNKQVLLVDDVITTGATVESCGKVLLNAGVAGINFAAIAAPVN